MSIPTRNPLRMAGANVLSSNVNTGELPTIRGGMQSFTVWSGNAYLSGVAASVPTSVGLTAAGYDFVAVSGAGRLNSIQAITQPLSGLAVFFYDAATVSSGGPFPASGHKFLGQLPPTYLGGLVSGNAVNTLGFNGQTLLVDFPYQSGLCIALKSGQGGFAVSWTPEANAASGVIQN